MVQPWFCLGQLLWLRGVNASCRRLRRLDGITTLLEVDLAGMSLEISMCGNLFSFVWGRLDRWTWVPNRPPPVPFAETNSLFAFFAMLVSKGIDFTTGHICFCPRGETARQGGPPQGTGDDRFHHRRTYLLCRFCPRRKIAKAEVPGFNGQALRFAQEVTGRRPALSSPEPEESNGRVGLKPWMLLNLPLKKHNFSTCWG